MREFLRAFVIFISLILIPEKEVRCQSAPLFPVRFSLFTANFQLVNPALMSMALDRFIKVGSQVTGGGFDRVYSSYITGAAPIFSSSGYKQRLGVSIIGDWEGKLISKSWASIDYAVEISVSDQWQLGAGAKFGFLSYVVRNTDVSTGGSDITPDMAVGIKIRNRNSHIAMGFNQLNKGELIPIDQPLKLVRNFNISTQLEFELSQALMFTPATWIRLNDGFEEEYNLSTEFTLNNTTSFQTLWFYDRNLTFAVGLKNINVSTAKLNLQISYTLGIGENRFDQFKLYEGHFGLNSWANE